MLKVGVHGSWLGTSRRASPALATASRTSMRAPRSRPFGRDVVLPRPFHRSIRGPGDRARREHAGSPMGERIRVVAGSVQEDDRPDAASGSIASRPGSPPSRRHGRLASAVDGPGQQAVAEADAPRAAPARPSGRPARCRSHEESPDAAMSAPVEARNRRRSVSSQVAGPAPCPRPGPVVPGGFVAEGEPIAHLVGDRWLGFAHPELRQHARRTISRYRLVLDGLEDQPERLVDHVRS